MWNHFLHRKKIKKCSNLLIFSINSTSSLELKRKLFHYKINEYKSKMKFDAIFKELYSFENFENFWEKIQVIYSICFLFNKIECLASGICWADSENAWKFSRNSDLNFTFLLFIFL
jgi:hypothetical protein